MTENKLPETVDNIDKLTENKPILKIVNPLKVNLPEKDNSINNAKMLFLSPYIPVYDIISVDKEQGIWKGLAMKHEGMSRNNDWIYFNRNYDDTIEIDRMYPEIFITDETVKGISFYLIPKDHTLFAYCMPTFLNLPAIKPISSRGRA